MTPAEKELVQATWRRVIPRADATGQLFYNRLFELDPGLRPLFKGDIKQQARKLMAAITFAVDGLDDLDLIVPAVRDLGVRHRDYGVTDAHYDTVGEALLWTLEQELGNTFSSETKNAWMAAYGLLAGTMRDATVSRAKEGDSKDELKKQETDQQD